MAFVVVAILAAVGAPIQADVLHLSGGGTIEGEVISRTSTSIVVKIGSGSVTLGTDMVARIVPAPSPAVQYQQRLAALKPTAEAQADLASWCEGKFLWSEAMEHYRTALKLDPDNLAARTRLGFVRMDGQWVTRHEARRLRAEKAAQAARDAEARKAAARTVDQRRKLYAKELADLNRGPLNEWAFSTEFGAAREKVLAISDSAAVEPLYQALARQKDVPRRQLLVDALSRIGGDEAAGRLVDVMTTDPNQAVAARAQLALGASENEVALQKMQTLLKTGDELARNRVAMAMGQMGSNAAENIPALIRNLVTLQERIIHHEPIQSQRAWFATGTMSAYVSDVEPIVAEAAVAFDPVISYLTAGCVLDVKATMQPWKEHIWVTVQHPEVLDSLIRITGQNFGYDMRAWYGWYYGDYLKKKAAEGASAAASQP